MKLNKLVWVVICFLFPLLSIAQQRSETMSTKSTEGFWKPSKIQIDGSNVMNGVEFYHRPSECNSEKVICVKLVNVNKFPVKVEWQLSPEVAKISVVVPASLEIEGNCNAENQDNNLANLVIPKKEKTEEQKKFVFLHLTVTEIKK